MEVRRYGGIEKLTYLLCRYFHFFLAGRTTSASLNLPLSKEAQRPKSSIPTFREIEQRVSRQEEINPNWDPNTELPTEQERESDNEGRHPVIENRWIFDSTPNTPGAK